MYIQCMLIYVNVCTLPTDNIYLLCTEPSWVRLYRWIYPVFSCIGVRKFVVGLTVRFSAHNFQFYTQPAYWHSRPRRLHCDEGAVLVIDKPGMKSRSRRLGLETWFWLSRSRENLARSRLEQTFKRLGLVSKEKVSFASLLSVHACMYRTEVKLLTAFGKMARTFQ